MKLQIVSKSQITAFISLVAINVAANWEYIAPVVKEAKDAPFFKLHHFVFTCVVAAGSILLAAGRSLLAHKSGIPPTSQPPAGLPPDRT